MRGNSKGNFLKIYEADIAFRFRQSFNLSSTMVSEMLTATDGRSGKACIACPPAHPRHPARFKLTTSAEGAFAPSQIAASAGGRETAVRLFARRYAIGGLRDSYLKGLSSETTHAGHSPTRYPAAAEVLRIW
jgi:hypothetical protein